MNSLACRRYGHVSKALKNKDGRRCRAAARPCTMPSSSKNLGKYMSRYPNASCSISRWCMEVALVISSMMSNDLRVGVLWLKYPSRRGKPIDGNLDNSRICEILRGHLSRADIDALESWSDPANQAISDSVKKTAAKFVIDFRLAELVWRRNTRFGAVVDAGILVNKWNEIKADSNMIHLAKTLQHGEKATSNHFGSPSKAYFMSDGRMHWLAERQHSGRCQRKGELVLENPS